MKIIIPYRNREEHLKIFLKEFHNFINRDDYSITVVEQFNNKPFNRAKLFNIGFNENKDGEYFCFHDVDMIPLVADYSYPETPIHMATNCSQFEWELPFDDYYGGVNLFNKKDFIKINGFSNEYWGWGIEDRDLLKRVLFNGFTLDRRKGVYHSLPHIKSEMFHEDRDYSLNKYNSDYDFNKDGLSTLSYKIIEKEKINDFSNLIKVDF